MGHLHQYGTECLIVDDAHDLSLEHLMFIKEVTDQGRLQYDHRLGLCLVAAGRGTTIPLKETLDLPDPTWLQFRRRFDKLEPLLPHCRSHQRRSARHPGNPGNGVPATLSATQPGDQWAGTLYTWLTHPLPDPTHSGRVTMDNLMKLVTTALEWTRSGLEKRMCEPSGSSPPPSCLCCVMILLAIIDGAGPDAPVEDQDAETKDRANGKEPERQTVQENEQQNTTKTVEMAKEPVPT